MPVQTGDIIIFTTGPGHAAIVTVVQIDGLRFEMYDIVAPYARRIAVDVAELRHDTAVKIYRPPWEDLVGPLSREPDLLITQVRGINYRKQQLMSVVYTMAMMFRPHAPQIQYGYKAAARLLIGSSKFGPEARAYNQRIKEQFANAPVLQTMRFDSAIYQDIGPFDVKDLRLLDWSACVTGVVIPYQIAFSEDEGRLFIRLDPWHTMPHTLRKWLESHEWTRVVI